MYKSKRTRLKRKTSWLSPSWQAGLPLAAIILLVWIYTAAAQTITAPELEAIKAVIKQEVQKELQVGQDTMWVVLAGCLVFFMNAGFAMLESGFCRQKNTVNILSKNLIVFALATVAFWVCGFAIMFGNGNPIFGTHGWFLQGPDNSPIAGKDYQGVFSSLDWTGVPLNAKFFFQLVFAGTAATIVSGAVAERIKFWAFVFFSLFLVGLIYPITGHWIWGGGWLQKMGFWDFAGSTVVHSVGGWAALTGAAILGPRLLKYENNEIFSLTGHNLSIATLGCFILWLGWFGFNPGSTMAANPIHISHIILTTNFAAATGAIAATIATKFMIGKPDLTMIINGVLSGLVAITASCRYVNLVSAVIIGGIAGILVVFSAKIFDELLKIDDPVGAISVHLVCGVWGTLAVGLFSVGGEKEGVKSLYLEGDGPGKGLFLGGGINQLGIQLLGVLAVSALTILLCSAIWGLLKGTMGIRVSAVEELEGLDKSLHGLGAYNDFQVLSDVSPHSLEEARQKEAFQKRNSKNQP